MSTSGSDDEEARSRVRTSGGYVAWLSIKDLRRESGRGRRGSGVSVADKRSAYHRRLHHRREDLDAPFVTGTFTSSQGSVDHNLFVVASTYSKRTI